MQYKPRVCTLPNVTQMFSFCPGELGESSSGLGRGRTGTEAVPPTTLVNAFLPSLFHHYSPLTFLTFLHTFSSYPLFLTTLKVLCTNPR
jgi:hypothetical protein